MVPGLPEAERAEQRHGDRLEQPDPRARDVVQHPVLRGDEPRGDKGEVARPPEPPRQRPYAFPHRRQPADGGLQQYPDPREHEEDGRGPWPAGREAARGAQGVEEPALREGEEARRGLAGAVPRPREPGRGRAEGDAEGLVPPAAPEPREPPVEDVVGEAAEEGRVVPEVGLAAEDGPEGEGADELPKSHHHVDGGEDAGGGGQGAVEEEKSWWQGGEEGRQRDGDRGFCILGP